MKKREDPIVYGEFVDICFQCEDKILYDKVIKRVPLFTQTLILVLRCWKNLRGKRGEGAKEIIITRGITCTKLKSIC